MRMRIPRVPREVYHWYHMNPWKDPLNKFLVVVPIPVLWYLEYICTGYLGMIIPGIPENLFFLVL